MTKDEMEKALKEGHKITHEFFEPNEWFRFIPLTVPVSTLLIEFEEGTRCTLDVFFRYRQASIWDDGYSIWQPQEPVWDTLDALDFIAWTLFDNDQKKKKHYASHWLITREDIKAKFKQEAVALLNEFKDREISAAKARFERRKNCSKF